MLTQQQLQSMAATMAKPNANVASSSNLATPEWVDSLVNGTAIKTPPVPTATSQLSTPGVTPSSILHPGSVTPAQSQSLTANLKKPVNALTPNAINDVTDIHRANVVSRQNMATAIQAKQVIQGYKAQIMQLQGSTDPTAQSQISQLQDAIKTTAQHAIDAQAPYTPSTDRSLNLTPEQIAGDSIGLGLDVGGALEGGSALTSLATPAVDAAVGTTDAVVQGSRAAQIAKAGAQGAVAGGSYGAAQGTAQGLSNNESAGGVIGSGLIGGAIGTATGGLLGGGIEAAPELTQGAKNLYGNAKQAISDADNSINNKLGNIGGNSSNNATDIEKIQSTISPKPTVTEAKNATIEGRFVKGKPAGWFSSGTEDTVIPSSKQAQSAATIAKQIPGAANMDEPTLYTALDGKVSEISQDLVPKMKQVPVTDETVSNINDQWNAIKAQQQTEPDFIDHKAGNKALQKQFETRLEQIKPGTNLNDLWDTAKSYDASVSDKVKSAGPLSDSNLQYRREMWLQNRVILREAITNAETGLGESSQAFSDMHDMYNAQEGILSKAKINTKTDLPRIIQLIKDHPYLTSGLGASSLVGSAIELGKHL